MLTSFTGRLSFIFRASMSASCWSRSSGWKNVITRSEFRISDAEWSSEWRNFFTSGNRLSATVLMFDLPTEIPICKLRRNSKMKSSLLMTLEVVLTCAASLGEKASKAFGAIRRILYKIGRDKPGLVDSGDTLWGWTCNTFPDHIVSDSRERWRSRSSRLVQR